MRNLSYRETSVALVLIAASCVASYRLWFAPALAQIERDRRTLEGLVAVLAAPPARTRPSQPDVGVALPPLVPSSQAPISPPPGAARRSERGRGRGDRARTHQPSKACDARDPLCDTLEL